VRSIWTGAISLSLLNIPVKLGSASKDNSLGLRQVRASDGSQIRYRRVAEADLSGPEVPWHEIVKGYDAPDGSLVLLEKSDFQEAYGEKNRVARLLMFTDASNIPPMAVKSVYWVQPEKGGEKPYALLASALQAAGKVAVISFAMRERVAVAVLRPQDGYLSLEALEWNADLLRPDFAAPADTSTEAERGLAAQMIESMSGKYDHSAQADTSTEALMAVIQGKIERGDVRSPAPRPDNVGAPQNLEEILRASVEAAKPKAEPARTAKRTPRKAAA
jgi:DNA end-binding protein Ku